MADAGLAGFAKGFANGFINERNRRLDAQKEMDQIGLRYRLEMLAKEKSDWQKKQEEEQEYIDNGKQIAKMVGNPAFAAEAAKNLKLGLSSDKILEMYQAGRYKMNAPEERTIKITNPDVADNKKAMRLPDQITPPVVTTDQSAWQSPEASAALDNIAASQSQTKGLADIPVENGGEFPNSDAIQKGLNFPVSTPVDPNQYPNTIESGELDKYDKKIRDMGLGSMIDYKKAESKVIAQQNSDPNSQWTLLPDTKEIKAGTLADANLQYMKAKQAGDKIGMADAQMKIEATKQAEDYKAVVQARSNGDIKAGWRAVVDSQGRYLRTIAVTQDAAGQPINPGTGFPVQLKSGEQMMYLDDGANRMINDARKEFTQQASKYNIQAESTAEAFDLGYKIDALLSGPVGKDIPTAVAGDLKVVNNAFTELDALKNTLTSQMGKVDKAFDTKNPDLISSSVGVYEKTLGKFEEEVKKLNVSSSSMLSQRNAQLALSKTLYDNYITLMAYKLAMANGQTATGMSNKDVQNFKTILGDATSDSRGVQASVAQLLSSMKTKIDQTRNNLDATFAHAGDPVGGMDLNLHGRRMGDIITDDKVRKYYNGIADEADRLSRYTADEYNLSSKTPLGKPPIVQEQKDEFGLVIGKIYPGAGGKMYKYLGGGRDPKFFEEVEQ